MLQSAIRDAGGLAQVDVVRVQLHGHISQLQADMSSTLASKVSAAAARMPVDALQNWTQAAQARPMTLSLQAVAQAAWTTVTSPWRGYIVSSELPREVVPTLDAGAARRGRARSRPASSAEQAKKAALARAYGEAVSQQLLGLHGPRSAHQYTFAAEGSLLKLSPQRAERLALHVLNITLYMNAGGVGQAMRATSQHCAVGSPLSSVLLDVLGGHDVVISNAFGAAVAELGSPGAGVLRSHDTQRTYPMSYASDMEFFSSSLPAFAMFKFGTIITAVFLQWAASALVAYILSETQLRMLKFTAALTQHVRGRHPLLPLVTAHAVDSIVFVPIMLGVLFFLFEFFGDKPLAFAVLIVMWGTETLAAITVRTAESAAVLPRAYTMLFLWFHTYHLCFPFGFHYQAFAVTVIGLGCTFVHLWLSHEVPALVSGHISAEQTRDARVRLLLAAVSGSGGRARPIQLPFQMPAHSPARPRVTSNFSIASAPDRLDDSAAAWSVPAGAGAARSTGTPDARHRAAAFDAGATPPLQPVAEAPSDVPNIIEDFFSQARAARAHSPVEATGSWEDDAEPPAVRRTQRSRGSRPRSSSTGDLLQAVDLAVQNDQAIRAGRSVGVRRRGRVTAGPTPEAERAQARRAPPAAAEELDAWQRAIQFLRDAARLGGSFDEGRAFR